MFTRIINWRTFLILAAVGIVVLSLFFSHYLSQKIAHDEKIRIEQWVEALNEINSNTITDTKLASMILTENSKDIPMIAVTETGDVLDYRNIDSLRAAQDGKYVLEKLEEFKRLNEPVVWSNPHNPTQVNKVYYGESRLLKQIRYFPIIQLVVLAMFVVVLVIAISNKNKSTQNQVWVGMAKETAHQLGTPLSSLQGWVEILKETNGNEKIAAEMSKDVERLRLVSDRFGKIGSTPQLEPTDVVAHVGQMVQYFKRRAPEKVHFVLHSPEEQMTAIINPPLFDWVIENLLKNALDALDGSGNISIHLLQETTKTVVEIQDTGKGIAKKNLHLVFTPGFSTKQRGWGLGLSLSKRIIEQYHKGSIFVKHSEIGKGTTFRIEIPR
jgi:signal transduction histidine kinase